MKELKKNRQAESIGIDRKGELDRTKRWMGMVLLSLYTVKYSLLLSTQSAGCRPNKKAAELLV